MELARLGSNPFRRTETRVHRDEQDHTVGVFFHGPEKTSDFRADISWDDVEKLIVEFVAMKEPKAIQLQQAKSLAVAARRGGWSPR